jgi:photosystem II protein PsbQ
MPRLRSILSLVLVLLATFLVSCSSPQATKIPTIYTPDKIAQLQVYAEPISQTRERMSELKNLIAERNWVDAVSLIHGPFGQLRQEMLSLSRSLLQKDQKQATQLAKDLFLRFERIDAAAKDRDAADAEFQYREAIKDFDAFLNLIPKAG